MTKRQKDKKHGAGAGVGTMDREKVVPPSKYKVVFYNDDYTHMQFVVEVLTQVFHMDHQKANAITMQVHTEGKGIAGVYSKEIAEMKVLQSMDWAKQQDHPLLVTLEKE